MSWDFLSFLRISWFPTFFRVRIAAELLRLPSERLQMEPVLQRFTDVDGFFRIFLFQKEAGGANLQLKFDDNPALCKFLFYDLVKGYVWLFNCVLFLKDLLFL